MFCGIILAQGNPLLKGVWGLKKGDNASFQITTDSIYYVEEFKSYKYNATTDSIYINLEGYKLNVKYTVTNDSLFWSRKTKVTKFVRFTE